jgi:hypothetical protein
MTGRRLLVAGLIGLGSLLRAADEAPLPQGWTRAQRSFAHFLEVRRKIGWFGGLEVTPRGVVFLDLPAGSDTGLDFWWSGVRWAAVSMTKPKQEPLLMWRHAMPGRQAIVGVAVTTLGYQHVTPIRWIEVLPAPEKRMQLFGGASRTIREVSPPENPETVWPNDRMLAWLDWQITPHRHPNDIQKKNAHVKPAALLRVDAHGSVHRDLFPEPEAEKPLQWRVYCNGKLVHTSPATGSRKLETASHGPGAYIVLLGLDAPDGFFPVSNLLQYTLAPQLEGKLQLAFGGPDYGDYTSYPPWYRAVLPPPAGTAPLVFRDSASLERARAIVAAWRGASNFGNAPNAPWILPTPELRKIRVWRPGSPRPDSPELEDLDSDDDNDGLTLREERASGVAADQADTDRDGGL